MLENQNQAQTAVHQVSVLQNLCEITEQCPQFERDRGLSTYLDGELYELMI